MLRQKVENAVLEGPLMRMELKHLTLQMGKLRLRTRTPVPSGLLHHAVASWEHEQCNHLPLTVLAT